MTRVWLPSDDFAADIARLTLDFVVDVYDGEHQPPSVEKVEFYVVPYSFHQSAMELAAQMPSLRVMQLLTAGYEHALPFVPDGVVLCNARGVHDSSTAELALALILASLRGIPHFVRGQDAHEWRFGDYPALADKTVLILGYGSIGQAIERRLLPFETEVIRVASRARPDEKVYATTDLPALLPDADVVVIVVPLTDATRGLVDADFLRQMKNGALLVNVARGGVVDTQALLAELATGRLHAALDVTDPEPPPAGHPLWQAPNLLISPHVGGNSTAFMPRARKLVREQLTRYVGGQPLANVVNADR